MNLRGIALVSAVAAGATFTPGVAGATPSSGVSATSVTKITLAGQEFVVRQLVIQPGGSTGWHWHDGTLYAYVEHGTLTHTDSDCTTTQVYNERPSFTEASGAGNVHIGRNLGTTPVTLNVLYVNPAGSPLSEDAANPGCSFQ